jgi:hypothetical protein
MSIGIVIADEDTFNSVLSKYYILKPEIAVGGMFSDTLYLDGIKVDLESTRKKVLKDVIKHLDRNGVRRIFAYNASFDYRHLPELSSFDWYDIMRLAAYRQFNPKIPVCAECHGTGRLKRGYGVEPILRMLSETEKYTEQHNALIDAFDELKIMMLLNHNLGKYIKLK